MHHLESHQVTEVFTPTKPARLTFIERDSVNDEIYDALRTPGKQVIVYGPSGSGKTTLLVNKLHQIYENHVTTRCTSTTTFEGMIKSAFDKLGAFYEAGRSSEAKAGRTITLSAEYSRIKAEIENVRENTSAETHERVIAVQLTPERLAEFCGAAGCCWVIEDFHKVQPDVKLQLAQAFKVFMDAADDFDAVKVVAIGAVNSAREVVRYEPEMINRVAEIRVPLMRKGEVLRIMDKGQDLLNFSMNENIKREIASYSGGLAAVCHQLCLNICSAAGIECTCEDTFEIRQEHLVTAVDSFLKQSSDTLRAVFDAALSQTRTRKYDNTRLILEALTRIRKDRVKRSEIMAEIKKAVPEYPGGNLTNYLNELQTEGRGAIITYDLQAKLYSFSRPIYRAYATCLFGSRPGARDIAANVEFLGVPLSRLAESGGSEFARFISAVAVELARHREDAEDPLETEFFKGSSGKSS